MSAESCHGIQFTRSSLKPLCNCLEKKVANRVPERVVDEFELVEIEKQKRDFVLFPTSTGECSG